MHPVPNCLAHLLRERVRFLMSPRFPFYPAQKANRTQGVHRRSHMPHTPAARASCHLLVGLMGTEDSLLIERALCAASAR